jgi:type IV pilus assembly protein PilA
MAETFRKRLTGKEEGFTLIELLVVIVILGVLLAIAVPSYMGFRDRAQRAAAQANVRSAIPSVEAYYQDNNTYSGMTTTKLQQSYDAGLKLSGITSQSSTNYCVYSTVGSYTYHKQGPQGSVVEGVCS